MKHGTLSGYRYHGCRCDECKIAVRDYARFYRQSKLTGAASTSPAAYNRALKRLVEAHVDEFRRLVDDETAREPAA